MRIKVPLIWGSILGSPYFGKLPCPGLPRLGTGQQAPDQCCFELVDKDFT